MKVGRPGVIAAAAQTAVRLTGKPECSLNISRRAMRLVSNCSEMFTESPPCDQKTFQSMKSYRQRVNERQQRAAGPTTWLWPPPAAWRRWRRAAAALLFPFFPFFPSRPSRHNSALFTVLYCTAFLSIFPLSTHLNLCDTPQVQDAWFGQISPQSIAAKTSDEAEKGQICSQKRRLRGEVIFCSAYILALYSELVIN